VILPMLMSTRLPISALIDAYVAAEQIPNKRVSHRVFKDTKKVASLRAGADITVTRERNAMQWSSDHWPDAAVWPDWVERPDPSPFFAGADHATRRYPP
jgi:hypothetical protein